VIQGKATELICTPNIELEKKSFYKLPIIEDLVDMALLVLHIIGKMPFHRTF